MQIEPCIGDPDFTFIVDLIRRGLPSELRDASSGALIVMYKDNYNPASDRVFFMKEDDAVVGYYRYSKWPRDSTDTTEAHLMDIAVAQTHEGRGLGKELLNHCLLQCRNAGVTTIYSATEETNAASIALHRSVGFRLHKREDKTIVWVKEL